MRLSSIKQLDLSVRKVKLKSSCRHDLTFFALADTCSTISQGGSQSPQIRLNSETSRLLREQKMILNHMTFNSETVLSLFSLCVADSYVKMLRYLECF